VAKKQLQSLFSKKSDLSLIKSEPVQVNCHEDALKLFPEAAAIIDQRGTLLYLNPQAEKLLGRQLRSVLGRQYESVFQFLSSHTKRPFQDLVGIATSDATAEYVIALAAGEAFASEISTSARRDSIDIGIPPNEDIASRMKLLS